MKSKSFYLCVIVLLLSAFALAQSTPYSTSVFSATFNGPVTTSSDRNGSNTSSDHFYLSSAKGITDVVDIRNLDGDIPVDKSSTDFYVGQATKDGSTLISRQDGTYQGHIYVFVVVTTTDGRALKNWIIILNSRQVLFMVQADNGSAGTDDWSAFSQSLNIK